MISEAECRGSSNVSWSGILGMAEDGLSRIHTTLFYDAVLET